MKRLLIFFLAIFPFISKAQIFSGGTGTLRDYNNSYIDNNASKAFTNLRLHNLLAGIIDWVDSARAGGGSVALGLDTLWAQNDTTLIYRNNGVFRSFTLRGAYDYRYKVDTLYNTNDSTLNFTINGVSRTLILPGHLQDLQSVTGKGKITTDSIIVGGIQTPVVLNNTESSNDYEFDIIGDIHVNLFRTDIVYSRTNWIRDHKTSENIQAVFQVGDLTNDATDNPFKIVDTSFRTLDSINLPYITVPGNHDYPANDPCGRDLTKYNQYMGAPRFAGKTWYKGNYNGDNGNSVIRFVVGSKKYQAIGLEFMPSDSAVAWANRVCDSFPEYETIILTHAYITYYKERSVDSTMFSSDVSNSGYGYCGATGQRLWDNLIKKHKNISFVFAGHFIPVDYSTNRVPVIHRITEAGQHGNIVNQFVVNYQQDTSLGGNTYMMRMKFRPALGKIDISFYSPIADLNDSRVPAYSIDYPGLKVEPTTGVAGKLNVYDEARFDSTIFFTKLPKGKLMVIGPAGKVDSLTDQNQNSILAGPISGSGPVSFCTLNISDLPLDSGKNIINQVSYGQNANFWIKGRGVIGTTSDYQSILNAGLGAQFYVPTGSGNWGICVQRAATGLGAAHFGFYHNTYTNYSIRVPPSYGDPIGDIIWWITGADSAIKIGARMESFVQKIGSNYGACDLLWSTTDTTGTFTDRMHLSSEGCLRLGGVSGFGDYRLDVQSGHIRFADLGTSGNVLTGSNNNGQLSKVSIGTGLTLSASTLVNTGPTISTGTSAPATTPAKVGDIYIDTTNKKLYFAAGISSSSDWIIAN